MKCFVSDGVCISLALWRVVQLLTAREHVAVFKFFSCVPLEDPSKSNNRRWILKVKGAKEMRRLEKVP